MFCSDSYVDDVNNICWSVVCNEEQPDAGHYYEIAYSSYLISRHPLIKWLKTVKSPWMDEDLKHCIVERDEAIGMANTSGYASDWQMYWNLRNYVTKLNKNKKLYYETNINFIKMRKNLWSTLNYIFGKKKQTQLHHALNQMAISSHNPLILTITWIIFFIAKISKLSKHARNKTLKLHIQV